MGVQLAAMGESFTKQAVMHPSAWHGSLAVPEQVVPCCVHDEAGGVPPPEPEPLPPPVDTGDATTSTGYAKFHVLVDVATEMGNVRPLSAKKMSLLGSTARA
jgi:hypothetical protein